MSTDKPEPGGPQKPKPRPYTPPAGAVKPSAPAPGPAPAEKPKYQPPPGAMKPPTPNRPSGAAAPAGQAAPRTVVGVRGGAFEFTFEQDALLKELGKNLKTVSWLFLLVAIALLARFAMPFLNALTAQNWTAAAESGSAILGALALLWIFWSLRQSGGLFQDIVESESQDVPLLMQALYSLNKAFGTVALAIASVALLGLVLTVFSALFALGAKPEEAPQAPPPLTPATAGQR